MGKTDVFLTHDWGTDESGRNNHDRVSLVNDALKKLNYETWFDSDRMSGDVPSHMARGIDNTSVVIVFITSRYRNKVNGDKADDNCKLEFQHALTTKTSANVVCVLMESGMRDTRKWGGVLGLYCASRIYIDMTGDLEDEDYLDKQTGMLCEELRNLGVVPGTLPKEAAPVLANTRTTQQGGLFEGKYVCNQYDDADKNDWHYVTISYNAASKCYKWTNRAGVTWSLYPRGKNDSLEVGTDCPYYNDGHTEAAFTKEGVYGPWKEFYDRV